MFNLACCLKREIFMEFPSAFVGNPTISPHIFKCGNRIYVYFRSLEIQSRIASSRYKIDPPC